MHNKNSKHTTCQEHQREDLEFAFVMQNTYFRAFSLVFFLFFIRKALLP